MTKRLWWISAALVIAALVVTGCKNGGDDDDDNDDGGNPQTCFTVDAVEFVADGPAGAASIWLDDVDFSAGATSFTVNVKARGLTGVYGVAGRLIFEGERDDMTLVGATPGTALGAAEGQLAAAASGDNHDIFGFTKKGDAAGSADITDESILGTLRFSLDGIDTSIEGVYSFDTDGSRVLDNGLDPLDVDGWGGGKLTITVTEHKGEASC